MKVHFPDNMPRVRGMLAPGVIALSAVAVRIAGLGTYSLWYDELNTMRTSSLPLASISCEASGFRHTPLYYLLGHFWFGLFPGDAWARSLSFLAGMASVLFIYLIGRELFSRSAGLWAAGLAAVAPVLVWYSQDATDYSWFEALSLLSFYLLVKAVRNGGWRWWTAYSLASVAMLYSHYYAVLVLLAQAPVFFLIRRRGGAIRPWLASQAAVLVSFIPLSLIASSCNSESSLGLSLPSAHNMLNGVVAVSILLEKGFGGLEGSGSASFTPTITQKAVVILALAGAIAVTALVSRLRRRLFNRLTLSIVIYTAIMVAGPVFIILAHGDFVAARYSLTAAPMAIVLVAALIDALPAWTGRAAGIFLAALMLFFLQQQRVSAGHDNWRDLMYTIQAQEQHSDEILCFPFYECLAAQSYYTGPNLVVAGGLVVPGEPQGVYLVPPRNVWQGYEYRGEHADLLAAGPELEEYLRGYLQGSHRIWVVAGTGNLGNFESAAGLEDSMAGEWRLVRRWNFEPLELDLYERK